MFLAYNGVDAAEPIDDRRQRLICGYQTLVTVHWHKNNKRVGISFFCSCISIAVSRLVFLHPSYSFTVTVAWAEGPVQRDQHADSTHLLNRLRQSL